MDKKTLSKFRQQLVDLRAELQALTATGDASSGTVELDQSRVGRLSRMDALQAQAMSQASGRRRVETLRQIDKALERVDEDDYGVCVDCGNDIGVRRLEFNPVVERCIACAELQEKR